MTCISIVLWRGLQALIPTRDDEHAKDLILQPLCKNVQNDEIEIKIQYVEMRLPSFILVVKVM